MNFMNFLFREKLPATIADLWFKFVGYLFTCSALRVAAEQSGSSVIWSIYYVSFCALTWWLFDEAARLLRSIPTTGKTAKGLNASYLIGTFVISIGISFAIVNGVSSAIEAMLAIEFGTTQT